MADIGAPPLPAFAELVAPSAWRAIDFLGDLHLSDRTPRTFAALAAHLRFTDADAVFVLGDLFEVWVGDDARHEGFEAECCAMLAAASGQRFIGFMAGNRDFLVGAEMLAQCGMQRLDDPTVLTAFGQRLLLSHGDALCLSDLPYQRFRAEVRSDEWQRNFLGQPLEQRRRIAGELRAGSRQRQAQQAQQAPGDWCDLDEAQTARWMRAARTAQLVHGHTHRPAVHAVASGLTRHVLSDWDADHASTPRADVLRWQPGGLVRMTPAAAP
jgi:UDP-2,3-diacylglucosamine hydrolase